MAKASVTEIKKAIKNKQTEIENIRQDKNNIAGNAAEIVLNEKKEIRAKNELKALENALEASSYMPPTPTDKEELLKGLEEYRKNWNERRDKILSDLKANQEEEKEIESLLKQAAIDADTDKTIKYSDRRDEIKAANAYLHEMLDRTETIPVYPAGVASDEWVSICEKLLPEWENRIIEVKTFAAAYKAAADALLEMQDLIKSVRTDLEGIEGKSFDIFFTKGKNANGMIIDKTYAARIQNMFVSLVNHPV